jgi:hypothetical protein
MFVLCAVCVLYGKNKRHSQDNEDKELIEMKYREQEKKSRPGHGCLSVVSVACLSGRGLCDGLITRPEESYRLCGVVRDLETSRMRRLKPASGL